MSKVHVVVGGQFGSEGKGHLAAQLAHRIEKQGSTPMVIRTGGPNAGHTAWGHDREFKLRQFPAACVKVPDAIIGIAAGSEIDPEVLEFESGLLAQYGLGDYLIVDRQATILEGQHINQEQRNTPDSDNLIDRIGSTGKGVGAARAARIMREAAIAQGYLDGFKLDDVADVAAQQLRSGHDVIIEATQGYGLGLHAGYYPKCTSRDVRAIDALGEVGISPWQPGVDEVVVWIAFRPYPIRVAGNSGELLGETTWDNLGLEPEYTTVTNKMRRVGMWDADLANDAIVSNGGPGDNVRPVLMMADSYLPSLAGCIEMPNPFPDAEWHRLRDLTTSLPQNCVFEALGTGPDSIIWATRL